MQIKPVILSGGSGTRLWPMSREHYPKQLLPLVGEETMLQASVRRLEGLQQQVGQQFTVTAPLLVCNEEHRFLVAEQLRQIGVKPSAIILESVGKNTAPALTLAAIAVAAESDDDPLLLVMPADHVVQDQPQFQRAVARGAQLAAQGYLVTFGIIPQRPETGYGYIKIGAPVEHSGRDEGAFIERFVEKPDAITAASYCASGEYLWNSGIFLMKATLWLEALGQFNPAMVDACQSAYSGGRLDLDFYRINKEFFVTCPSDSIDYAVMERVTAERDGTFSGRGVVVPLDVGWSDVGAWAALWEVSDKDAQGNVIKGDVYAYETNNALLVSEHRLVTCVGLDDVIVIETPDAVMVAHQSRAQDVKQIVAHLKSQKRSEYLLHRKVSRPWGHYDSIDNGERFQVKRIVVNPGATLSMQMHHHRAEHWIVVRGTARVTRGDELFLLTENQSTYIPIGITHRLENPGTIPLELIEVQSGSYLGEDDIVRFDDNYGRVP